MLCVLLASFFATFAIPAAFAPVMGELRLPSIANPLKDVGDTVVIDVLTNNVEDLWSVELTVTFDTDVLTPVGYFFVSTPPGQFYESMPPDLNDAMGYVHIAGSRTAFGGAASDYLGTGDGATTTYSLSEGVIEPGSESAFYGVFGEFLGVAQDPYGWGRDDGPWTGGGGDGIVDTMPVIPAPYPGIEMVYDDGSPYLNYGDPTDPRWAVDYATGEVYSPIVYPYISRWPATGSVMTIDYATTAGVPAIASIDYAHTGGVGSVTFATAPAVGEEVYMQYRHRTGLTTGVIVPLASIVFSVDSRGYSPLHFESTELLDIYMPANSISHTTLDGYFDNRLQGTMSAPNIVDTGLTEYGSYFDVFVSIGPWMDKDVEKLWGYQFIMDFDPSIVMAVDFETLGIFMPGPSEIGYDYIAVSGQSYYGDPNGLSTDVPVPVARIGFVVLDVGVTLLGLHDTVMVDVMGKPLYHETVDGSFANTMDIAVCLTTIFVESRKWSASTDGSLFTMTAQVKSMGTGVTKTRGHFKVTDMHGIVVADLTTPEVNILPDTTIRLDEQLNVGPLGKPGSYVVEGTVEYLSHMGSWVTGQKGSPEGARTTMVKTFTLYP
jgi:hypothetical protein